MQENEHISEKIMRNIIVADYNDMLSNQHLVEIINLCGQILNLKTISEIKNLEGKTFEGVRSHDKRLQKILSKNYIITRKDKNYGTTSTKSNRPSFKSQNLRA